MSEAKMGKGGQIYTREAKYTPGPWYADESRPGDWRIRKADSRHKFHDGFWEIAEMSGYNPEANARLIAAAPLMLKALREVIEWCVPEAETHQSGELALAHARAAIAAATGEDA